jgi:hypothetical protein
LLNDHGLGRKESDMMIIGVGFLSAAGLEAASGVCGAWIASAAAALFSALRGLE